MAAVGALDGAVAKALRSILDRVSVASKRSAVPKQVRVVAVSKTKPVELIKEAYNAGHRTFGENYAQELIEKVPLLPDDVRWHYIGHLQSNKVKFLLEGCPRLAMMETVDSIKLANKLDKAVESLQRDSLCIMIQVNTSGEDTKFGVDPGEVEKLASHVVSECKHLRLAGLMTIGQPDYSSRPENFECLTECRKRVCEALGFNEDKLELSMGMSGDFEQAIELGSTNVRIGSVIFGARDYSKK